MKTYNHKNTYWEFVCRLSSTHRIFRAKDGNLAIAGNSGQYPHETEDGTLWIREDVPCKLRKWEDMIYVSVPVEGASLVDDMYTSVDPVDAHKLVELGFKVIVHESMRETMELYRGLVRLVD